MGSKKLSLKGILIFLLVVVIGGLIYWKLFYKIPASAPDSAETLLPSQIKSIKAVSIKPPVGNLSAGGETVRETELDSTEEDDAAIQEQLDKDREFQKQTKYLKMKLEQTDLELEQEKALAEINKLKEDNMESLKEPAIAGQNNLPDVKVKYIGGNSVKKEAILSISGTDYQVKEKSSPTDNIQIVSISDTSVTVHFSAPQVLTKTIDYKPE